MNYGSTNYAAATITSNGSTVDKIKLSVAREIPQNQKINGSNNGVWGVGMSRGALFPPAMNGPLGYINHPLPYDQEVPVLLNSPKYSSFYNGPAYNQPMIKAFSGYTFDGTLKDQAPVGEKNTVLVLNPNMS